MLELSPKGLWYYCEEDIAEPDHADKEGKVSDEPTTWRKEMLRAKEILYDGMTDQVVKTVKYEPTPFRVVERLKKSFVGMTYFKYAEEMTKLCRLRLDPKAKCPVTVAK